MPFKIVPGPLQGLLIITPQVFTDARGYFFESYAQQALAQHGVHTVFVQDNISHSQRGTVRGLHYQAPPHAQAKLVSVLQGEVLDVVVDIRRSSPSYGQSYSIRLSAENKMQLYIPEGFAHGFSVLSDTCLFCYKCSNYYHKASEGGIAYNDPALGIDWQVSDPIVSEKDLLLPNIAQIQSPFA